MRYIPALVALNTAILLAAWAQHLGEAAAASAFGLAIGVAGVGIVLIRRIWGRTIVGTVTALSIGIGAVALADAGLLPVIRTGG